MQSILSFVLAFFTTITTQGYTVQYTREVPAQVDNLTLRLHCQAEYPGYWYWNYGVTSIDVLEENGTVLQTLSVDIDDGYWVTQCWNKDGDLFVEDLNFDGFPDLRLMEGAGVVNLAYLCWLWNPETGQYQYASRLYGYDVILDSENKQILTESRDGWGQYYTDTYAYDESGQLRHLKQVHEDYAEGTTTTTIYD